MSVVNQIGFVKEAGTPGTVTGITAVAGAPNTGTVAVTSHGHSVGDVIITTGFTPSGWNGTFRILSVPTANSFTISTGSTLLTNSTVQGTYTVSKFGGGGTPSRFFENPNGGENVKNNRGRVQSSAVTSGIYADRADRFVPYGMGAAGDLKLEVLSKGFAYWIDQLMGICTTTGPTDTAAYTHTGTIGSVLGKSGCLQIGRDLSSSEITQPFTYKGAKVQAWKLENAVDGILMLTITFSFQSEDLTVQLAAPSYPTGAELLTFVGGTIQLAGVSLATVSNASITCQMGLSAGDARRFISGSGLPQEPLQTGKRNFSWAATVEFYDPALYTRYVSATAAGALTSLSAAWVAPTKISGAASTFPSFTITAPNARHDGETPVTNGPNIITMNLGGPCLNTAATSNDALTMVYVSGDVTP